MDARKEGVFIELLIKIKNGLFSTSRPWDKYHHEEAFWVKQILKLTDWYNGKLKEHYGTPSPFVEEKLCVSTLEHSAILTWFNLHQKPKYSIDLQLSPNAFFGMKVLDVGAGPMPSAEVFDDCELYCLDPLFPCYLKAGYPLHYYKNHTRFVYGYSEAIPLPDDFVDAVISVNAIDHVDDFYLTAREIQRVLKPNGMIRMHVHYHQKTKAEPLELNDEMMREAFKWCKDFKKISETNKKFGSGANAGESFNLWSNFC